MLFRSLHIRLESVDSPIVLTEHVPQKIPSVKTHLSLNYDGALVPVSSDSAYIYKQEGSVLFKTIRNKEAETHVLESLTHVSGEFLHVFNQNTDDNNSKQVQVSPNTLIHDYFHATQLLKQAQHTHGFNVELTEGYAYDVVDDVGPWYADFDNKHDNNTDDNDDLEETSHRWFSLELGIDIAGQRVSLLPILLRALKCDDARFRLEDIAQATQENFYIPMEDGRSLPLPTVRLRAILGMLVEILHMNAVGSDGRIRLSAWQAAQLADLEAAAGASGLRWLGPKRMLEMGRRLRDFKSVACSAPPQGLRTQLRGYQEDGYNWLRFLRSYNMCGILADDMGLGKTVQMLAHLLRLKEEGALKGPVLVVAPTSVVANWERESQKLTPDLRVLLLRGTQRHALFSQLHAYDLILTTYPLIIRDHTYFMKEHFDTIVLDEAQTVKNALSRTSLRIMQLRSDHRLSMTGTPMENHLGEFWAQFNFLMPGLLGD